MTSTSNPKIRFNKSLANDEWLNADLKNASKDLNDSFASLIADLTSTDSMSSDSESDFPTEIKNDRPTLSDAMKEKYSTVHGGHKHKQEKSKSGRGRAEKNKIANELNYESRQRPSTSSVGSIGRGRTENKKDRSEGSSRGHSATVRAQPFCLKGSKIDTPKGRTRAVTPVRDRFCPDDEDASETSSSSKLMRPRLSTRSLGLESPRRRRFRKKPAVCRPEDVECPTVYSMESSSTGNDDICKPLLDKSDSDPLGNGRSIETGEHNDGRSQVRRLQRLPAKKIVILGDSENSKTERDDPLPSRNLSARAGPRENKLSVHSDHITSSGGKFDRWSPSSPSTSPLSRERPKLERSSQSDRHFNSSNESPSDRWSPSSPLSRERPKLERSSQSDRHFNSSNESPSDRWSPSSPLSRERPKLERSSQSDRHFNSSSDSRSAVGCAERSSAATGRWPESPKLDKWPTKSTSGERPQLQRSSQSARLFNPSSDSRSAVSGIERRNIATSWRSESSKADKSPTKSTSGERPQLQRSAQSDRHFNSSSDSRSAVSGVEQRNIANGRRSEFPKVEKSPTKSTSGERPKLQRSAQSDRHFNSSTESRSAVSGVERRNIATDRRSESPKVEKSPTKSTSGERPQLQRSAQSDRHFNSSTESRSAVSGAERHSTATGRRSGSRKVDKSPTKSSSRERPQLDRASQSARHFISSNESPSVVSGVERRNTPATGGRRSDSLKVDKSPTKSDHTSSGGNYNKSPTKSTSGERPKLQRSAQSDRHFNSSTESRSAVSGAERHSTATGRRSGSRKVDKSSTKSSSRARPQLQRAFQSDRHLISSNDGLSVRSNSKGSKAVEFHPPSSKRSSRERPQLEKGVQSDRRFNLRSDEKSAVNDIELSGRPGLKGKAKSRETTNESATSKVTRWRINAMKVFKTESLSRRHIDFAH
jgi:hypothetical protein